MPSASLKSSEDQKDVMDVDPFVKINRSLDRKIRNLERRRVKLEKYKEELENGKELDLDQNKAVEAYDSVVASIGLCQEFASQLTGAIQENEKSQKALAKKRLEERAHHDSERIKQILKLLDVQTRLKDETFREDFVNGTNGALQIPEDRLLQISKLENHILLPTGADRSRSNAGLKEQLSRCAENMGLYLDGKNKPIMDTTFREMRMTVLKIANTTYPKLEKKSINTSQTPTIEAEGKLESEKQLGTTEESIELLRSTKGQSTLADSADAASNSSCEINYRTSAGPESADESREVDPGCLENESRHMELSTATSMNEQQTDLVELVSGSFDFLQESQVTPDRLQGIYVDPAVMSFGTVKPESLVHMHEQQKLVLPSHPPVGFESATPVHQVSSPQIESHEEIPRSTGQRSWDTGNPKNSPQGSFWNVGDSMAWNSPSDSEEKEDGRDFNRGRSRRGNYKNRGGYTFSNSKMTHGTGNGYRGRGGYRGSRPARAPTNRTYGSRGRGSF